MATPIAALIFRPEEVSDRALSQGFAVALGGFDVPSPRLLVAPLTDLRGWSAAFYSSAAKIPRGLEDEEHEHACELFEEELSPALAVLDAAAELGHPDAVVYGLTYSESALHDDAWRFDSRGVERHYVHDTDEGIFVFAGFEGPDADEERELEIDAGEGASEKEEEAAAKAAAQPHRGTTFLSRELGGPILGALMGALFGDMRRVDIHLVEPGAAALEAEVTRLNRALRRVAGRGAFTPPKSVAGVPAPAAYEAFVRAYDFADPADPQDLYRELAIGAIEGTLKFLRLDDFAALERDADFRKAAAFEVFPIARLFGSALGAGQKAIVGLAKDGAHLKLVKPGGHAGEAGPTFGELIRYLALGWSARSDPEEDMIGALMLRAKLRADKG